jgi:Cu(I)/Ag(I) efflux system membrane protein CusA/SilA
MLNKLIRATVKNYGMTIVVFSIIAVTGVYAFMKTTIDALPDLSENQVVVMTEWPGQNPKNVEDQVTYPLTVTMQGVPYVKRIRSMSQMGLSMVTVIFEDDVDIYFARNRVAERLSMVTGMLPPQVQPVLGPDATALGQVFMYTLESEKHSLTELRTIQDFTVQYALQSVNGVAEVASVGGYVKTYQVVLDPVKLMQLDVPVPQVLEVIRKGINNVSGKVVVTGETSVAIQGVGFIDKVEDIQSIAIGKRADGVTLTVSDIGTVRISALFRRGILADEESEKVGGFVIIRYGENPLAVIDRVKAKIAEISPTLPEGITIEPFYDRTRLIKDTVSALEKVLTDELIITIIVLGFFLWHFGTTLITAIALVMGVLITFVLMWYFNIPSNIMSLGGIAVAIGSMVDASIVVSENAYRKLLDHPPKNFQERMSLIIEAAQEVGRPILFAMLITIMTFLPVFALQGMEGKLFSPLAYTHTFSLAGAVIAGLFLAPMLSVFLIRGKLKEDDTIPAVRFFHKLYQPLLLASLKARKKVITIALVISAIGILPLFILGSEFMPPLDEGSIMYMPLTLSGVSEKHAQDLLITTNKIIAEFPEVEKVVGKAGRAKTATDPAPLAMFETIITLKPKSEWRPGLTKQKLVSQMNRAIKVDNLWNGFTQPIIGRIDMLATGIRSQIGVKIFGDDPIKLEALAIEAEKILEEVPGGTDVAAIRTMGLDYLNIHLKPDLLAKYGVAAKDVLESIDTGIGGMVVATTIEGRKRFDIEVRMREGYRQSLEDIASLPLDGFGGAKIILGSVAVIEKTNGPSEIQSENGILRSVVQLNVEGRDLVSFVDDAKKYLEQELELPSGYYVNWSGQYENHLRAKKTFSWMIPAVVVMIFFLLYMTYKDLSLVMLVMATIPLGLVGGFIALFLSGYNFSVAVWVGFIDLFGSAAAMGVVKVVYLENAFRKKFGIPLIDDYTTDGTLVKKQNPLPITMKGIHEAVIEGALLRLRPILMTGLTAIIGLVPMLWSEGVGVEVTKPLAVVMVGGLITVIAFTIFVLPILFSWVKERKVSRHLEPDIR